MAVARTVRHLRLRGPDQAAIRRAALKLEDALRTASLPGDDARIVLVRRLTLGRIDADAAPATLALAWERTMARSDWRCVHGRDAQAGSAPAVWFVDALDAHAALALRLLSGPAPREWFWPLAIPAWRPSSPAQAGVRAIARSLLAREEAASALPAWFAEIARAGHAACLPHIFEQGDLPVLQRVFAHLPDLARALALQRPGSQASSHAADVHTLPPPGGKLLAAALLVAGGAQTSARRMLHGAAHGPQPSRVSDAGVPSAVAESLRNMSIPLPKRSIVRSTRSAMPRTSAVAAEAARPGSPLVARADSAGSRNPAESGEWFPTPGETTSAGGIAFLLPVLQRLGFPEWLSAQTAWSRHDVLQRVFAIVLARLDIDAEDPAWTLAGDRFRRARAPRSFIAPACWRNGLLRGDRLRERRTRQGGCITDDSGHLLLAAWRGSRPHGLHMPAVVEVDGSSRHSHPGSGQRESPGACSGNVGCAPRRNRQPLTSAVAHAWVVAVRRWLRRHARIGLGDLVHRPARLVVTATHLDLHFHPGQIDLRLRRHGLDLDPGWVPWYGRVVAFHYQLQYVPQRAST